MDRNRRFLVVVDDKKERPTVTVWIAGVAYEMPTSEPSELMDGDVCATAMIENYGVLLSPGVEQWIVDYVTKVGVKEVE